MASIGLAIPSAAVAAQESVVIINTEPAFQTSCSAAAGKTINYLAISLQDPLWICTSWIIQGCMTPLTPGQYGQCEWAVIEIFKRIVLVSLGLGLGPSALVLALLASMVHWVGDYFLEDPYVYLPGNAQAKLEEIPCDPQNPKDLSILTLNTCMTSEGLPLVAGGQAPTSKRIAPCAHLILEQDADVVCLQETGSTAFYALQEQLKSRYAHSFGDIGSKLFNLESCLCVFSKRPIIGKPQFKPFESNGFAGYNRGMFYFKTDAGWIINLHLHWNDRSEDQSIRTEELQQVQDLARSLYEADMDTPIMIVGDFNIKRLPENHRHYATSDEYSKSNLSNKMFFHNVYKPEQGLTYSDQFVNARLGKKKDWLEGFRKTANQRFELNLPHIFRHEEGECVLDYAVVSEPKNPDYTYHAEHVQTAFLDHDEDSFSDHHGILFKQKRRCPVDVQIPPQASPHANSNNSSANNSPQPLAIPS